MTPASGTIEITMTLVWILGLLSVLMVAGIGICIYTIRIGIAERRTHMQAVRIRDEMLAAMEKRMMALADKTSFQTYETQIRADKEQAVALDERRRDIEESYRPVTPEEASLQGLVDMPSES